MKIIHIQTIKTKIKIKMLHNSINHIERYTDQFGKYTY